MGEEKSVDTIDGPSINVCEEPIAHQQLGTKMAVDTTNAIQNGVRVPESIRLVAHELSQDIIYFISGLRKGKAPSKHASTLRRTVEEMTVKHEILYKGMINKLEITGENVFTVFKNVASEIFRDNQLNWGRLVSVYAFGAQIGKHLCQICKSQLKKFCKFVGNYVVDTFGHWIHNQGGWDAFDDYFPEQKNIEDSLWKGLVVTAFGLGALATMVVAVR